MRLAIRSLEPSETIVRERAGKRRDFDHVGLAHGLTRCREGFFKQLSV